MAQYLAERLTAMEGLTGAERSSAESAVVDLVLRLWRHRAGVAGADPLADVGALARAVARLDPERDPWGFFRPFGEVPPPEAGEIAVQDLLMVAERLDRAVGDLVAALVQRAAVRVEGDSAAWVAAVRAAGAESLTWLQDLLDGQQPGYRDGQDDEVLLQQARAVLTLLTPPHTRRQRRRGRRPQLTEGFDESS